MRHAQRKQGYRDFCFSLGPIEIVGLLVIQIEFKRFLGVGGIARFYADDVAANAIESGDRLAELRPFVLRGAAESEAERDFVVSAKKVTELRGERAEVADLRIDFGALGGKKRRVSGRFDDFSVSVGENQKG